jgi:hypothetical protein
MENLSVSAIVQTGQVEVVWIRVPDAVRIFGLSRSGLYELITAGKIKSTCLKKQGAVRGIRLINYNSLAAFIENASNERSAA